MSTSKCIAVLGTASLQRYIFQSNRLKENIGASYLAKYWLDEGLIEAIKQVGYTIDTDTWNAYKENPSMSPSEKSADTPEDVNLIYVGGGNAALLFKNQEIAKNAVKAWSRKLLENAPGLRVAVGYADVKKSLAEAYRSAMKDLSHCEEALPFGATLYGLPVVRTCTTTGLPASVLSKEETNEEEWISQSAARKRNQVGTEREPGVAHRDIRREFKSVLKKDQNFAIELNKLGGREGESHIAVVHADGNGMGKHLINVVNSTGDDVNFLHHIRAFSASVAHLSRNALKETLQYLRDALPLESLHHLKKIFPLRPIVYGGDDLTFVCDGRLGLNLAAFYLKEFSRGKIKVCGEDKSVDACAGIAIVPTKFPFARAYHFAEELCGLAKSHRRKENNETGSWLDFQIIPEGATRSISALRAAQYQSLEGQSLHQRPYQVPEKWKIFVAILKGFQSQQWPRNRAKGLLQAITQGPVATKRIIDGAKWREVPLPYVKGMDQSVKETGWTGGDPPDRTTPYFDPLEALDFYLEVKKPATDGEDAREGDKE